MTNADALDAVREAEHKLDDAHEEIVRLQNQNADLIDALLELIPLIEAEYPAQQHVWLANARAAIARAEGQS